MGGIGGGDGIQTRFLLQFQGRPGVGTICAKQARGWLRNEDGSFKEFKAQHVTQQRVKIFVNHARSRRRFAEERPLRRLRLAAGQWNSGLTWSKRRGRYCEPFCNWVPVSRVECRDAESTGTQSTVRAYPEGQQKTGVDLPALVAAFRAEADGVGMRTGTIFRVYHRLTAREVGL